MPALRLHLIVLGLSVVLGSQANPVAGQNAPEALLTPPADSADYDLLGEFAGELSGEGEASTTVALQVRPVGEGDFDGLMFTGGLPGEPGHRAKASRVEGLRAGDVLILSGTDKALFVQKDQCRVVSREGELLGTLQRVRRTSSTLGAAPPNDAVVLFDGSGTENFEPGEMSDEGLLKAGADLSPLFQDFDLHVEFKLPYMPGSDSQARANSGIYLHSRYECQVLDSFAQPSVFNGCGAIYRFKKPDVNMCLPPLVWQTYDIRFTAARWNADGSKRRNARITSWLNGVKIQDNVELVDKTGSGKPEGPTLLPTKFQNHKDPVRFRNIWIIDRGLSAGDDFPPIVAEEKKVEEERDSEGEDVEDGAE